MEKFKNKYRIPSARASWWDYANAGAYFITICTADRAHFLGEIVVANPDDVETRLIASLPAATQLNPTPMGELAESIWYEIPNQFAFIQLGAFVVMPNHVHGILIIDPVSVVETRLIASLPAPPMPPTPPLTGGFSGDKNPMLHDNISRVVRWYKGRCTFEMRKIHADFAWQARFHDHIIRNEGEYGRISNYIVNNPSQWAADGFFSNQRMPTEELK
jgi:REP element-mobilizing transposase RayT